MSELRVGTLVVALLCAALPGWAQTATPSDQEAIAILVQQVRDLQKETGELREKVKALEGDRVGAPAPAGETAPVASQPPQTSPEPAEPPPGLMASLHELRGIQWRGFGELDYKVLNQRQPETATYGFVPGSAGSFYTGDFGLFLTSRLTDRASVLSEIVFEEGDAQSYKIDLRRILLKYDRNDHLKFSFGRYQTNIG
ncbi:MAG: hypothetical protein WB562_02815, partial [Candidatus Sulfotelmatobacter sp.]